MERTSFNVRTTATVSLWQGNVTDGRTVGTGRTRLQRSVQVYGFRSVPLTVGENVEAREACVRMAVVQKDTAVGKAMMAVKLKLVMCLQNTTVVWEEQ